MKTKSLDLHAVPWVICCLLIWRVMLLFFLYKIQRLHAEDRVK